MTTFRTLPLLLPFVLAFAGCGEEAAPTPTESADPIVGVLELPISLRHQPNPPSEAVRIEIAPTAIRVNARTVLTLTDGKLANDAILDHVLPAVKAAIDGAPARRSAIIRANVSIPFRTTSHVLYTIKHAHLNEVAFEVRPGPNAEVVYLVLDTFDVRADDGQPVRFEGEHQRQWNDFVAAWDGMKATCDGEHSVDCDYQPDEVAEGGDLQIRLYSRDQALKIELERFGVEQAANEGVIDGLMATAIDQPEHAPKAISAAFTWRYSAATDPESPITATIRPLCGSHVCGVVVAGDVATQTLRLVSFIGAAFPNGATNPSVVFLIPNR